MTTKPRKGGVLGGMTGRMANLDDDDDDVPSAPPLTGGVRSAPAQILQATGMQREMEALKKQKAGGVQLRLSQLRSSPYQLGPLMESRVAALVANLAKNPLSSPIVVRPTSEDDVFEMVAGHHRAEAFRRLGRSDIAAVVRELSDDEAERVVFYDNLLAPELTDYDKYLGFSARRASRGMTQEQLAEEAGVAQSVVSRLLSFEKLPPAAQELVKANPTQVGARLFQEMAALATAYEERVVEALSRVIAGKLTASAAPGWVKSSERAAPAPAAKTLVKRGKSRFAEVRCRGSQVVISFSTPEDASACNEKLIETLKAVSASAD